jgi:hypothetical protein
MNRDEARSIMSKHLEERSKFLTDDETEETPYVCVFQYDSRRYLETGDSRFTHFGNCPWLVDKVDGAIHYVDPSSNEEFITNYERQRGYRT